MERVVVALDVGGTSIKAGLIDRRGALTARTRRPTEVERGPDAVIAGILRLAQELAAEPGVEVAGIGICVPGLVDPPAGMVRYAVNLGWDEVPLAALLRERTGLPVALGHDVRTAALAEARHGAGVGESSMFFVAIGTGVAGGHVRDGVVDDGASGWSGEIGHLVVEPGGPACRCGNRGCLETIASASRIAERYLARTGGGSATAADVAGLVRQGDPVASMVWQSAVDGLARALAAATVLMDPAGFVLGGGLSLAGETLVAPLAAALAAQLTFRSAPTISLSALGDQAGVIGAGVRAWDQLDALGTGVPSGVAAHLEPGIR